MDVNVWDYATIKARGMQGSVSGSTITQAGAFGGVSDGDILWIMNGIHAGSYLILSHTSDTATVQSASWAAEGDLEWKVTTTLTLRHRAGSESHLVDSGTAIISTSPWTLLQTGGFTNVEDGMEVQVEVDGVSYYYPIVSHDDNSLSVEEWIPTSSETTERPWWVRTTRGVLQPGSGYDVDTLYSPGSFAGVQVGDTLWLQSGPDMGMYTITHVTTNSVKVAGSDWTPLNNVRWKITAGTPYDCTTAFQAAIDAASVAGGKVNVPSGYYYFAGSLEVKRNTVLTGMWNLPPQWSEQSWMEGVVQGPVLCPTDGRQDEEYGAPFITIDGNGRNAGVEGLSIYYPLQGIVNDAAIIGAGVASYPWCIHMESEPENPGGFQRMQNVQLVNPYKGIHMNLEGGSGYVSGVFGCPLSVGVEIECATDTVYVEKINFHPENWMGSFVDSFSNAVRTQMLAFMQGFRVEEADHVVFNDISLGMAATGISLTTDGYSTSPVIEATNIAFDMVSHCISANSGTSSFVNASLHTFRVEGNERLLSTPGAYPSHPKCVDASGTARMSFLGGDMATSRHGVYWSSEGCLNVSGVSIANVVADPANPSYGVYAEAGSVLVHGNVFPNDDTGFTEAFHITSGVAKGLVFGNDFHTTNIGTNEAANRDLVDAGDFNVSGNITANGDITANGNLAASYDITAGGDVIASGNVQANGTITAKAGSSSGTFKAAGALFNVFGSATTSGSTQTALLSGSLPANSLTATGDKIRVVAGGTFAAATAGGTAEWEFILKIGSTEVFSCSVNSSGAPSILSNWRLTIDIWKNGSNAVCSGQVVTDGFVSGPTNQMGPTGAGYNSVAVDFTSAHTIQIFGEIDAINGTTITQNVLSAEIYPAP